MDVIVTQGTQAAAKRATNTIPIVVAGAGDLVAYQTTSKSYASMVALIVEPIVNERFKGDAPKHR